MELLDRYLQAVGFWLPRRQKEDILAELSEDLRSQIEDKEAEFGRPLSEREIETIIKQRGRPMMVAGAYLPKRHLIGPVWFPSYWITIKIMLLCYLVQAVVLFATSFFAVHPYGSSLLNSFHWLWLSALHTFAFATSVFAVLDWVSARTRLMTEWNPRNLASIYVKQRNKRAGAIAGLVFGILGIFWLLAVPKFPFLILGPAALFLKPAPIWQTVYLPILLVACAGIAEHILILIKPQLTWVHMILKLATTGLNLWIIHLLWQTRTYLLATDSHAAQVAAAVNLAIPISLVCVTVGLGIGMLIYIWQFMREPKGSERIQSQGIFQI